MTMGDPSRRPTTGARRGLTALALFPVRGLLSLTGLWAGDLLALLQHGRIVRDRAAAGHGRTDDEWLLLADLTVQREAGDAGDVRRDVIRVGAGDDVRGHRRLRLADPLAHDALELTLLEALLP